MNNKLGASFIIIATIALSLATFMQVLDTTIANVSIPAISGDLGVSPNQGSWVITSFAASNAIAMPLTGWLARRFGEVKLFVASTLLFTITSWMCGLADSFGVLVLFRVLQGAAAAPMMPLSQSLLLSIYPDHKKGLALAFWGMTVMVAPIFGPLLGGYITDNYAWPWIFYINIPIGIISTVTVWFLLNKNETKIVKTAVDTVGLALLILGVGALQIMLDKGNELDWFSSDFITILGAISIMALSFFVVWEIYHPHPMVDLSLFKGRNFTVGTIALSIGYLVFMGGVVVYPLWLQTQMGYTAYWAGFVSAGVGIFGFILSPIIGQNLHRLDLRIVVSTGFLIFATSYLMQSNFNPQADMLTIALPRIVLGVGTAMYFVPLTTILLASIEPSKNASAMGLVNFLRVLGGAVGTSISISMWDRRADLHHERLCETITPYSHSTNIAIDAMGGQSLQTYASLERMISSQAITMSTVDIFWISGLIMFVLIGVVWLAKPPFMNKKATAVLE